jgi:hypothetical protein
MEESIVRSGRYDSVLVRVSRLARDRPPAPNLGGHVTLRAFGDVCDLLLDGIKAVAAPRTSVANASGLVTANRVTAREHIAARVAWDVDTIVKVNVRPEFPKLVGAVGPAARQQHLRLAWDLAFVCANQVPVGRLLLHDGAASGPLADHRVVTSLNGSGSGGG